MTIQEYIMGLSLEEFKMLHQAVLFREKKEREEAAKSFLLSSEDKEKWIKIGGKSGGKIEMIKYLRDKYKVNLALAAAIVNQKFQV